jgi:3'(2'), 5'-bisphosphate nucleotidase
VKDSIPHIIKLLRAAGRQIMEVYAMGAQNLEVEWKKDSSPLTLADRLSHEYLMEQLAVLDDSIPIMSEESVQLPYSERRQWRRYWCLDPLDGTKEFIKRNDQFTINLALVENALPSIGFIHIPVSGHTYWAMRRQGAFLDDGGSTKPISANRKSSDWIAIGSSSHGDPNEVEILRQFPITDFVTVGSALKFCRIASGDADVYYRKGPTMEWDTAAGHILVEEAGAAFKYLDESVPSYNKESLTNSSFLVHIKP